MKDRTPLIAFSNLSRPVESVPLSVHMSRTVCVRARVLEMLSSSRHPTVSNAIDKLPATQDVPCIRRVMSQACAMSGRASPSYRSENGKTCSAASMGRPVCCPGRETQRKRKKRNPDISRIFCRALDVPLARAMPGSLLRKGGGVGSG